MLVPVLMLLKSAWFSGPEKGRFDGRVFLWSRSAGSRLVMPARAHTVAATGDAGAGTDVTDQTDVLLKSAGLVAPKRAAAGVGCCGPENGRFVAEPSLWPLGRELAVGARCMRGHVSAAYGV
jgi:hypothetical protein